VLGAGRHLLALINDILDLSKIEAGRMELHLETFPLAPIIGDVGKTIEPMATKNANRIVIDCPADLGTMHADQTRFRQALLNLAIVLAAIKGDPELAGTPVVLMSIVDQKNRGYALGAADYLVKPVDRATLVGTLRNICGATAGRVLLVDDDEMVRRSVRQAREPIGWEVTEAENGRAAVGSLISAQPDVIILDLMMPKMDGFEFMDELRERSDWKEVPVVVITAKDLTQEDRDRLNGGVERIIQKSDCDEMLRQLSREISKCVKRRTMGVA
jgi:CheY-like chemotaxis protein